jgi:hypothetical protein
LVGAERFELPTLCSQSRFRIYVQIIENTSLQVLKNQCGLLNSVVPTTSVRL